MANKKKPLPPRYLRMNREARLSSARHWLATQKNGTPVQIAKSYRKRYGVDWACAALNGRMLRLEPSVYAYLKSAQSPYAHPAHPLAVEFQLSATATFLLLPGALLGFSTSRGAGPGTRKIMAA
jgi:hypothetical protein